MPFADNRTKVARDFAFALMTMPAIAGMVCFVVLINTWARPSASTWNWGVFYLPPVELLSCAIGLIYFQRTSQSLLMDMLRVVLMGGCWSAPLGFALRSR